MKPKFLILTPEGRYDTAETQEEAQLKTTEGGDIYWSEEAMRWVMDEMVACRLAFRKSLEEYEYLSEPDACNAVIDKVKIEMRRTGNESSTDSGG